MAENTPPLRDYPLGSITPQFIHWPLTADNLDVNGANPLETLPSNPTPFGASGFIANGTDAKCKFALPAWASVANADLSLFARLKAPGPSLSAQGWRELAVSVLQDIGNDKPKLELALKDDPSNGVLGLWFLRASHTATSSVTTEKPLVRCGWRFEFCAPERISSMPLPQSLCWLNANELLLAVDIVGSGKCALYRWDVALQQYTGRASSTTYQHLNSLHLAPDGSVWCQCRVGGFDQRKRIDLAASFASGNITESASWNTGDVPTSSISFATIAGVEYVLLSQYTTSGTPRVYVFLRSQMSGTVNKVDRVLSIQLGLSIQDLVQRASDGYLYVSRSSPYGRIDAYDLAAILAAGVDDTAPAPVATYPAATQFTEGLDFHPVTDRLWMCTEGHLALGDYLSGSSVWSSAMLGPEENSFAAHYVNTREIFLYVNGRLMHRFDHSFAFLPAPTHLSIGAAPGVAPPLNAFLQSGAFVRDVAISSLPFSPIQLAELG